MPETVNCNSCGALTWATDIPSQKTGFCWRCEIKRLSYVDHAQENMKAANVKLVDEIEELRKNLAMATRDLDHHKTALFVTAARLRVLLLHFSSVEIEAAVATWLEGDEGEIDLLNPPKEVDELFQKLEPLDRFEIVQRG